MNVQTVNFQGLFFVNVSRPTEFEMKFLRNTYEFSSLNLEDYLFKRQIPKIEKHEKYNLMVLRFPVFSEYIHEGSNLYGTRPAPTLAHYDKKKITSGYINFFISKDSVVIIHDGILPQIDRIFSLCQKTLHNRTEYMGKGAVFLAYKIIDALVDGCFPIINDITATIDRVDKELEEKQTEKTLEDISLTRRNLVVFHTMINPVIPLFRELKMGEHKDLNGGMKNFWGNTLDHLQKIMDRVEDNQELIGGISESSEFVLRSKTNQIMATLTIVFTLTIPATVVGTYGGMNIILPGGVNAGKEWFFWGPYTTFYIVLILSIIPVIAMVLWFKHKKWS